MKEWTNSFN